MLLANLSWCIHVFSLFLLSNILYEMWFAINLSRRTSSATIRGMKVSQLPHAICFYWPFQHDILPPPSIFVPCSHPFISSLRINRLSSLRIICSELALPSRAWAEWHGKPLALTDASPVRYTTSKCRAQIHLYPQTTLRLREEFGVVMLVCILYSVVQTDICEPHPQLACWQSWRRA